MQLNLDFCFIDDAEALVVTGWSTNTRPDLVMYVGGQMYRPRFITRHSRRDLRSSEPFGILALFDMPNHQEENNFVHLEMGGNRITIHPDRQRSDFLRLLEIGVDEVFIETLRLMAQGHLHLGTGETGTGIIARLRNVNSAPLEAEAYAIGVDRARMTEYGQGMVLGWFLPGNARDQNAITALAMDDEMLVPVRLLLNSIARADLAGYAPNYCFSGSDGYCGGWQFPRPSVGPVQLLFTVPYQSFYPGILMTADLTKPEELAQELLGASASMTDVSQRRVLRRSLLPPTLPRPLVPSSAPEAVSNGETLLILDHDLQEQDLRDVLRRVGKASRTPFRIHLLRNQLTDGLRNGIESTMREVPTLCGLDRVSLQITPPTVLPEKVIYARSSTLFQFDLTSTLSLSLDTENPFALTILDPIGTVASDPVDTTRFVRDMLPFVLLSYAPAFFDMLSQFPHCFLTEEARVRIIMDAAIASGHATISRTDIHGFFEGKTGPYSSSLIEGKDWHTYDSENWALIEKGTAA